MTEASVVAVGTPQSFRQQIARALELEADEVGWVQSATAAEELLINAYAPVDVLVLSPEVKEPDALGLAEFVGRTSPGTAIVLVRDHTWNGLLPAAMRAGIRDVVDMTQGTDELREAVERAVLWAATCARPRSACRPTAAGCAGGTSSRCSRPKAGRARRSSPPTSQPRSRRSPARNAVVDLDVDMGDVFTYFGREPSASITDLMALGEGADGDQIRSVGVEVAPHVWAFGAPPDPAAEAPAGEAIGKFLRSIRSEFDYVVVDASVDYSDSALVCFDLSDMICLVTGLDVVGVKHLSKALDTLLTIGLPRERFRVVLNRADSKVGLDASDVERVMKIQVDAMIPSSRLVPTSLNKGRPVVLDEPQSEVSASIRHLAVRFTGSDDDAAKELVTAGANSTRKRTRAACSAARPRRTLKEAHPMSLADRLAKAQQRDRISDVRGRVQERLVESLGPRLYDATMSDTELEGLVHQRLRELLDEEEGPLSAQEKLLIVRQIGDSVLGLGPLEPFVRDPEVTEIMVNNWDTIYVERAGRCIGPARSSTTTSSCAARSTRSSGRSAVASTNPVPYVDARLPDGSRVNAVIPPLAIDGPALTIRKFAADPYQADDLIEFGTMTSPVAKFLEACVRGRINIMVAGGTGAGKTTTLNVISSFIPDDERILTIEDAAELKLQQPHVVRLESRPPNIEGKGQVSIRDLSATRCVCVPTAS